MQDRVPHSCGEGVGPFSFLGHSKWPTAFRSSAIATGVPHASVFEAGFDFSFDTALSSAKEFARRLHPAFILILNLQPLLPGFFSTARSNLLIIYVDIRLPMRYPSP